MFALCASLGAAGCGGSGGGGRSVTKHLYFSQDDNGNGLYELDLVTGAATLVGTGATGTSSSTIGLTETDDPTQLIGSTYFEIALIAADGSGATVLPTVSSTAEAEGLAMNITTGILYADINGEFFTVDPITGTEDLPLAAPPFDCEGLAADPVNNLVYGIGPDSQDLFRYDPLTNTWDAVGSTGRDWTDAGLAYDRFSDVLYAVEGSTDSLYRIDPATGATTLVGPLGIEAHGGLAFVGFENP